MKIKVGDLVRLSSEEVNNLAPEEREGIVLELFPGKASYVNVYWFSYKEYGACPADDLEVISESR